MLHNPDLSPIVAHKTKKVKKKITRCIYNGDYLIVETVMDDKVYSHRSSQVVGLIHILVHGTDIYTAHILHHTYTHCIIQYAAS